LDLAYQKAPI